MYEKEPSDMNAQRKLRSACPTETINACVF